MTTNQTEGLKNLETYVFQNASNIKGIVVLKNGQLLYENYRDGFTAKDTVHVMSVTKSVVSLLIGIALSQGLIKSIEQPVLDFFPEYTVKRGEKTIQSVTLRHLLTMTAPYKYRSEPWTKICTSPNWTTATLDILGGKRGLTGEFKYSTLGVHILTGIISKQSGLTTVDYANKYLFEPMGIARHTEFVAKNAQEHKQFTISKAPKTDVWFSAPDGVATAGYGLCLSPMDMAKLGQLCLDEGFYDGSSIVPAQWIRESTSPHIQSGKTFGNMHYGYMWWIPTDDVNIYAALGNSGNVIYVNKKTQLVVGVASTFKPSVIDRVQFIQNHIEPFV